jgi:predicted RNA-binding Zn-ribbon protein involved in translation (DUF1610 family)
LLLDIETAPNLAHVWGLFKQNVSVNQIIDSSYTLCWSAKWYKEEDVAFSSLHQASPKKMLKEIHGLLSEADAVVHYNGNKFDIPVLNTEFILHGMTPPAPSKQIDLYGVVKSRFRFTSNKLEFVARELGVGEKHKTGGHELWIKCMAGEEEAWATMQEYNIKDVILLERVYDKLKPWIRGHANHNLYAEEGEVVCPNCGEAHFQRRGFSYTSVGKYRRYVCKECGAWFRNNKGVIPQTTERYISE